MENENQVEINEEQNTMQLGFFSRVSKTFYEPLTVFRYLKEKPDFIILLVIMTAITVLGFVPVLPLFKDLVYEQLIANPAIKDINDTMINGGLVAMLVASGVMTLLGPIIKGALSQLLSMLFNGKGKTKSTIAVFAYASIPSLVGFALQMGVVFFTKNPNLQLSLVNMLDPLTTNPFVYKLAAIVNPFTIWYYVLAVIGLSEVQEIPKLKALIVVIIPTLIMLLL